MKRKKPANETPSLFSRRRHGLPKREWPNAWLGDWQFSVFRDHATGNLKPMLYMHTGRRCSQKEINDLCRDTLHIDTYQAVKFVSSHESNVLEISDPPVIAAFLAAAEQFFLNPLNKSKMNIYADIAPELLHPLYRMGRGEPGTLFWSDAVTEEMRECFRRCGVLDHAAIIQPDTRGASSEYEERCRTWGLIREELLRDRSLSI